MLSEMSQPEKDIICFHSYVDPEKLNRRPVGRGSGREKESYIEGRRQTIRDS